MLRKAKRRVLATFSLIRHFAGVSKSRFQHLYLDLAATAKLHDVSKNYFYLDSGLQRVNPSQFKEAKTAIDSDTYRDGEIVETWDHVFFWTPDCVPLRKWEQWRLLGDSLTDAALPEIMGPAGGSETDLLARQRSAAQQHDSNHAAFRL